MKRAGWDLFSLFTCHSEGIARRICCNPAATKSRSFALLRMTARGSAAWHHAIGLAVLLFMLLPAMAAAPDPILHLGQAEFILSDAAEPPPDTARWQPQTLPDNWNISRPDTYGYAWYRLRFELPQQPGQPYAIYLPRYRAAVAVYLNGTLIRRSAVPMPANQRPTFFSITPALLHPGSNTLHLQMYRERGWRGGVSAIQLGEENVLRPAYDRQMFLEYTGVQWLCVFSVLLGLFMLLLWLRRSGESAYGYFGLAGLLYALFLL